MVSKTLNQRPAMRRLLLQRGWRQTYIKRATRRSPGYATYSSDKAGRIDVENDRWCHYFKNDVFGTSVASFKTPLESLREHLNNLPAHALSFEAYLAWKGKYD